MKTSVIFSSALPENIKNELKKYARNIIELVPSPHLSGCVKAHPDTLIFADNGRLFVGREYLSLVPELNNSGLEIIETDDVKSPYPTEASLNAFSLRANNKDILFGNTKTLDKTLISYYDTVVSVKQGYAHCSTAKICDNAVITADMGIYDAVIANGCDALLISSGNIKLTGYEYGFIGGASVLCDNKLLFFGDVTKHHDYNKMKEFSSKFEVELCSLSNGELADFGSGVII